MRKPFFLIFPALVLLSLLLALGWSARATPTLIIGSLSALTNTTATTTPITAFAYNSGLQQFTVTHSALTSTNDARLDIFCNVQGAATNGMVKIGSWWPSTTNAATETFSGANYVVTNYVVVQAVVGANGAQLGGSYGQ